MTARRSYARVLPGSRGRGRGRGSFSNSSWSSPSLPSDRNILEGLNVPILESLPIPADNLSDKGLLIDDVEYIGSYNWMKTSTPQSPFILVPGRRSRYFFDPRSILSSINQDHLRFGPKNRFPSKSMLTKVQSSSTVRVSSSLPSPTSRSW